MKKIKIILTVFAVFLMAGCSNNQSMINVYNFSNTKNSDSLKEGEVDIFFYRMEGNKNNVAVVKVGERLVGSILPLGFAHTKVCVDKISVGVAGRGNNIVATKYLHPIGVDSTDCLFFKVNEASDGSFYISMVDCETGKKDMNTIGKKSKIINRNLPDCKVNLEEKQ